MNRILVLCKCLFVMGLPVLLIIGFDSWAHYSGDRLFREWEKIYLQQISGDNFQKLQLGESKAGVRLLLQTGKARENQVVQTSQTVLGEVWEYRGEDATIRVTYDSDGRVVAKEWVEKRG